MTRSLLSLLACLAGVLLCLTPIVKVTVLPSLGSGVGIKAAAKGALDIAVGSRPLTEGERKLGLMQSEQTC